MHTRGSVGRLSVCAVALASLAAGCSSGSSGTSTPSTSASGGSAAASPGATATSASATPTKAPVTPVKPAAPPASAKPAGSRAAGLVRVQVNNCQNMVTGSGFFVDDDLVLTAAHLFKGAASVAVHSPGGVVRGKVLGTDAASDLALVQLLPTGDGSRLTGPAFSLGTAAPKQGDAVTLLAYPAGRAAHQAAGTVEATDGGLEVDGTKLEGLISHTANAAPGNSGGVLLDASGKAVGMEVSTDPSGAGVHHAVPMTKAAALMKAWKAKPAALKMAKCEELGPPSMTSIHPDAPAIKTALSRYLWGMSYPTETEELTGLTGAQVAWQGLGPAEQKRYGSPEKFLAQHKGVIAGAANVDNLEKRDEFTDTLIWTLQLEGPGKKCQVHTQRVVLSSASGSWVIDQVAEQQAPRSC
ncbi:serine protease [Luteococcus peritonei]|uniref:S1C family serine protease n=1 Tax=Luteococcus peritonei TaxID=88874 RepID=A0ABW4RW14_9ACTN